MKAMIKVCSVALAVLLSASVGMAQHRGNYSRGSYRSDYGRHSYQGHSYRGGHHGYYRNSRGDLFFGLLGVGIAAAVLSNMDRPVCVQPPVRVVYHPTPVTYVPQPQVVYIQPTEPARPTVVVEPVLPAMQTPPVTATVNLQNTDGSYTPVTLRQAGAWWVGPKGEYYRDGIPTVGQLRALYGR
jgi:hypothetical protein